MTRIEQYEQALADARRVRRERERQPACHRSHGHRDAADGDAAERSAAGPPRDGPDGRSRQLHDGDAQMTAAPRTAFEALVARYPETPNVHYAYGVFLLIEQPDKAIEEFKRELRDSAEPPGVTDADRLRIPEGEATRTAALPWAKQAVEVAPEFVRVAQGAWRRASRDGRYRGRASRAADRRAARPRQPEHASVAGQGISARRPHGRRDARARGVRATGSPAADHPRRRTVGRRHRRRSGAKDAARAEAPI